MLHILTAFWQSLLDELHMLAFVIWNRCQILLFSKITFQKVDAVTEVFYKKVAVKTFCKIYKKTPVSEYLFK